MRNEVEVPRSHTPVLRRAVAGVILVIAAAVAIKLAIGFLAWIFWTVVVIALVAAVLWAVKTLIW